MIESNNDLIHAMKLMLEFQKNSPTEIKIITSVSNKDKQKAIRYFKKNFKKLGCVGLDKGNFSMDSLIITYNPQYKKFNPRQKFRGKNYKFMIMGIDSSK